MHVVHIRVVLNTAADEIMAGALAGDTEAQLLLAAVSDAHRRIAAITEPDQATSSCMCCGTPLWSGFAPEAIVVCTELDDDASAPMILGICGDCRDALPTTQAVKDAVIAGCQLHLNMPELRLLPMHEAGHA